MRPRNPPCSATGSIVRTGCTTVPLEKSASALSMAGITSCMRSIRPTALSSRFIPAHLPFRTLPSMVVDNQATRTLDASDLRTSSEKLTSATFVNPLISGGSCPFPLREHDATRPRPTRKSENVPLPLFPLPLCVGQARILDDAHGGRGWLGGGS